MAMSVGGGGEERPMSDINTTPLVDVMLVLLIIFLIAVPVAIQTVEKLKVPILVSEESQNKVENLMLSVVSTDASGRSPKEPGYEGSTRNGQCRVYFNNITPVDNQELYKQAFDRLDAIVKREGGAANMDPEKIPKCTFAATSTFRGSASPVRSTTCRPRATPRSASSRPRSIRTADVRHRTATPGQRANRSNLWQ
jgi:biopolymer transport protein ExbD